MAFLIRHVTSNSKFRKWLPALALIVATFIVYFPAINGGEIWDDRPNITDNPLLRDAHGLWLIWADFRSMPAYYPVTHTNWWIDYQLFGLDLRWYHLESVAMHAANAVLIWLALRQLGVPGAWLAAALWAVHPIHVESVAWITERKNTLSVLLYLISFHCYLRASGLKGSGLGVRVSVTGGSSASLLNPEPRTLNPYWYLGAILIFAIALPAKTPVVTLPAAILLAWWYVRGGEEKFWRTTFRRELKRMIPFFFLGACMGSATVWIEQHHSGAIGPLFKLSPLSRLVLIGRSFWFYAWKVLVPHDFLFVYPRWHIDWRMLWQLLFPLSALALLISLAMLRCRTGRGLLSGVLFYVGTAFPALGIAPIYYHRYSYASDHFSYLSNAGLTALVAWIVVQFLTKRKAVLWSVAAAMLVGLSVQTWRQTHLYKDNFTIWSDVLKRNPSAWMAEGNLAVELLARGQDAEAEKHLERQLKMAPDQVEPVVAYAQFLATHGRLDQAIPYFKQAIASNPDYLNTYGFYGRALAANGREDEAIQLYENVLKTHPELEPAWLDLADIYQRRGDLQHAANLYQQAITAVPRTVGARVNLANLYLKVGNVEPAIALLKEAAELANDDADIHNRYGLVLLQLHRYPEAVDEFRKMVDLTRGKEGAHIAYHNLATALEGAGRIAEAELNYKRALALKPDFAPAQRNLERLTGKSQ